MIEFTKFTLENNLRVIVHVDKSTPLACLNILYDVGARDEDENKTGFAHLFEHLMFGGSVNIPSFDEPLQMVGGENNAFTTNDITNYYSTVPAENIETMFWLESDRLLSLAFTDKSLDVQRSVVIEEFKQRYLNQPYGDVWLILRPLVYEIHPYKWATIGKEISHIENANMEDVKAFFKKHYNPSNAIMVIAGDVDVDQVKLLAKKWFEPIPIAEKHHRNLPIEPKQTKPKRLTVERDVPASAIYKVYHMCARGDEEYHTVDIISDILSRGNSSRLYKNLIKDKQLFSDLNAYVMGDLDKGIFVISGKIPDNVIMEDAEKAIIEEVEKLRTELVGEIELQKCKNKIESSLTFSETDVLTKATNLAISELLGSADLINEEITRYNKVTAEQIKEQANLIIDENNCTTLYYLAKNKC
ncbi:MAG: pitrilysin family protein [Bacteroidota bacterium]|nr:pitrilysin family protein [Bacteroidota bacterium]MDP3145735.1 pitrilysin family protein [Bacteroidota bacterium]MDP3556856.1 pitrilysin family protein [Bacteroidota bacterium]